ncbi:hypothetical protein NQ318_013340 [Aromia moschata]|uniref:Secreted protein n=1 Tax=Aromia moschata TaxID=1265417 RepID=A0AAV8XWH6_9CUCU|nr:hypothetical protein NQ318_013340 [Aromia moschata]
MPALFGLVFAITASASYPPVTSASASVMTPKRRDKNAVRTQISAAAGTRYAPPVARDPGVRFDFRFGPPSFAKKGCRRRPPQDRGGRIESKQLNGAVGSDTIATRSDVRREITPLNG